MRDRRKKGKDGTPEFIGIPLKGSKNQLDAVLHYFSTLAYPNRSERRQRQVFVTASAAWRYKLAHRCQDFDPTIWPMVPALYRQMKNEKINGVNRKGMKRVAKRLWAGSLAWSLLCNERLSIGFNPTTAGIGIMQMSGMATVAEGIRELLRQKEEVTGVHYNEPRSRSLNAPDRTLRQIAEENVRRLIWSESMPVLHLAVSLHLAIQSLGSEKSHRDRLFHLLFTPGWVLSAFFTSEYLLPRLHERIPLFDPCRAVRFYATDGQPENVLDPRNYLREF